MEPLNEIAHSIHAQPYLDVSPERPQPMTLPLPCKLQGLVPEAVRKAIGETRNDGPNRRVMPGPIIRRTNRVYASTVRTAPPPKPQRPDIAVEISKDESMSPDPGTSTPLAQTPLRSRKRIALSQPENLLDTQHEKKGQ